jgi:hypothetical protein
VAATGIPGPMAPTYHAAASSFEKGLLATMILEQRTNKTSHFMEK